MLQVDQVCRHSYISSNLSIQPGYEWLITTGMVNSCYGLYNGGSKG